MMLDEYVQPTGASSPFRRRWWHFDHVGYRWVCVTLWGG